MCGPSGEGSGPGGRFCNMFNPGSLPESRPSSRSSCRTRRTPRATSWTTTTSRRTSASRGGRTSRAASCAAILGDPEVATISTGFSRSYNRERFDRFNDRVRRQPGRDAEREPQHAAPGSRSCRRASPGRSCSAKRAASARRRSTRRRRSDSRDAGEQPARLRSGHRGAVHGFVAGRPAARARSQHRGRGPLRGQPQRAAVDQRELEPDQHLREQLLQRVPAAQANLRANVLAGPRRIGSGTRASRARARCRSCWRTSAV